MVSPKEEIKSLIISAVKILFPKANASPEVEKKEIGAFGDFSSNVAFILSKTINDSPIKIAEKIEEEILRNNKSIEKIEIAGGGFLNFFLKKDYWLSKIKEDEKGERNSGKVIIDYSSPNIAKPMHVGHLRATILGDFLYRLYKHFGYKVIRWNHLGDWGTQFGMIIAGYKTFGDKKRIEKNPIAELLEIYVKFNKLAEGDKEYIKRAQEEFKKLEDDDKENKKIWSWVVDKSIQEFKKIYKKLGIDFDAWVGESFYNPLLKPLLNDLKNKKITTLSEGAYIVPLDKFDIRQPALLEKTDGATLYITRDLASLKYRIEKYKPSKLVYVVGAPQILHFKQLFALANILGFDKTDMIHASFGLILGPDGKKLATREGKIISADDLIRQVEVLSKKVVDEKRPDLKEKERGLIAEKVAIGALKYNLLKDYKDSDIIFDPEKALAMKGDSSPYIQYTYVRFLSILSKNRGGRNDLSLLEEKDVALIKKITSFADVLEKCLETSSSNYLTAYLFDLSNELNSYYESTPITKDENNKRRNSRILIIQKACEKIKVGLEMLGIEALKKI